MTNRRDFLKTAVLATLGAGMIAEEAMADTKKKKIHLFNINLSFASKV